MDVAAPARTFWIFFFNVLKKESVRYLVEDEGGRGRVVLEWSEKEESATKDWRYRKTKTKINNSGELPNSGRKAEDASTRVTSCGPNYEWNMKLGSHSSDYSTTVRYGRSCGDHKRRKRPNW